MLVVPPEDHAGTPDPQADGQGMQFSIGPLERFEPGKRRRLYISLQPAAGLTCQPGAPLWATVSLEGAWLRAAAGQTKTVGGLIVDCGRLPLVVPLADVEQREP